MRPISHSRSSDEGIELISRADFEHFHGMNSRSANNSATHDNGDAGIHEDNEKYQISHATGVDSHVEPQANSEPCSKKSRQLPQSTAETRELETKAEACSDCACSQLYSFTQEEMKALFDYDDDEDEFLELAAHGKRIEV